MSDIELQRLERCKKCSKSERTDNFMRLGITAIIYGWSKDGDAK